ncbi:hypothetical protein [Oligoflexus tunisiensis]|uniref:hypothetical protein n=1 Tax=Oligoflexus tunisiensis TaxID=708132 RepID=UPI00114D3818|nr:hypothetical protein [Oligoflexus tunisiensis]
MMKSGDYWTEAEINASKQRIKDELDQRQNLAGPEARQQLILDRLKEYEGSEKSAELLDLFVYLVSALVHHSRFPFLTQSRYERLLEHARTILQSQGIREGRSRVSFLHGELHFIQSQIERQEGRHWTAAWHQFMGYHATRGEPPGGEGFQQLSLGNRAMRLGHTRLARGYLEKAESLVTGSLLERCRLSLLICLRLLGEKDLATERLDQLTKATDLSEETRRELSWEKALHDFVATQDLVPLLMLTRKGQSCYHTSYLVELSVLAMATSSRQWLERIPKLENLRRRKDLEVPRQDLFLNLARTLQEAYDTERPMSQRLHKVGESLSAAQGLFNVEKELLYWAAAARWLLRSRSDDLAALAQAEYESRSLLTSDGRTRDIFQVFT